MRPSVAGDGPVWPRGFPLDQLKNRALSPTAAHAVRVDPRRVGVYQLCADHDPDVDAVYRMTRPLPFSFAGAGKDGRAGRGVAVPRGALAPWNAQATVHARRAFWAMLLPQTVPGRVSDIWRAPVFRENVFLLLILRSKRSLTLTVFCRCVFVVAGISRASCSSASESTSCLRRRASRSTATRTTTSPTWTPRATSTSRPPSWSSF